MDEAKKYIDAENIQVTTSDGSDVGTAQNILGNIQVTEAIQSIQDEFEKIIVITHVDTMKESFEHRIEVFKTPEGSTIQVS